MVLLKWISKIIGGILAIAIIYIGGIIIIASILDYKPHEIEEISRHTNTSYSFDSLRNFSLLSWNIGYCGLGAEMDFFYDGGKKVKTPPGLVERYSKGIADFLSLNDTIDFIFLQEVDERAARSAYLNELELLGKVLPEYHQSFAVNYKSFFVPIPIFNPMGSVTSGIVTLSKSIPTVAVRHNYRASYPWPKRLFMLDRCFLVNKYRLFNGKELVIINTHNSAFDASGELKEIEMPQIRDYMIEEYENGNYVIAGGDWNQNPPGFDFLKFDGQFAGHKVISLNSTLFSEDWKFLYSPVHPTNRNVDIAWDLRKTETTIIDFFIISPNIQAESIRTLDLNFEFSDHEPSILEFAIEE